MPSPGERLPDEPAAIHCEHCGADVPLDQCESTYCGSIHLGCGAVDAHAAECGVCRQDFEERGLIEAAGDEDEGG
jgi:hypothetical protein